ncbi:MAG: glycosyltransferase family 4 protein [Anaerolineales bacterium]|nr:glycosyltransferase family 4 protein [Anaerolineales bacterium]
MLLVNCCQLLFKMINKRPFYIMHVIDALPLGGAERMLVEIANATCDPDFRVSVCVTRSVTSLASELNPNIRLHVLNRTSRFSLDGVKKMAAILQEEPVDLFHVHGRPSFAFLSYASFLCRIKGAILLHDHDGWVETVHIMPLWFRILARIKIDYYVGVHEQMCHWARQGGIPSFRVGFISNALNLMRFQENRLPVSRAEIGVSDEDLLGVWVGGIRRQKGLHFLIEALHGCQRLSKVKVLIIGDINERDYYLECLQKIAAYKLEDVLVFTGRRTDIPSLVKIADFALLSSQSESGPLVLIEYLASGLPIVAVETGSISHRAAQHNIPGFVPVGDTIAYCHALEELFQLSPEERRSRGALGVQVATEHFEISQVMPEWYHVYRVALKKTSK